jgi:archaellum component FlaC
VIEGMFKTFITSKNYLLMTNFELHKNSDDYFNLLKHKQKLAELNAFKEKMIDIILEYQTEFKELNNYTYETLKEIAKTEFSKDDYLQLLQKLIQTIQNLHLDHPAMVNEKTNTILAEAIAAHKINQEIEKTYTARQNTTITSSSPGDHGKYFQKPFLTVTARPSRAAITSVTEPLPETTDTPPVAITTNSTAASALSDIDKPKQSSSSRRNSNVVGLTLEEPNLQRPQNETGLIQRKSADKQPATAKHLSGEQVIKPAELKNPAKLTQAKRRDLPNENKPDLLTNPADGQPDLKPNPQPEPQSTKQPVQPNPKPDFNTMSTEALKSYQKRITAEYKKVSLIPSEAFEDGFDPVTNKLRNKTLEQLKKNKEIIESYSNKLKPIYDRIEKDIKEQNERTHEFDEYIDSFDALYSNISKNLTAYELAIKDKQLPTISHLSVFSSPYQRENSEASDTISPDNETTATSDDIAKSNNADDNEKVAQFIQDAYGTWIKNDKYIAPRTTLTPDNITENEQGELLNETYRYIDSLPQDTRNEIDKKILKPFNDLFTSNHERPINNFKIHLDLKSNQAIETIEKELLPQRFNNKLSISDELRTKIATSVFNRYFKDIIDHNQNLINNDEEQSIILSCHDYNEYRKKPVPLKTRTNITDSTQNKEPSFQTKKDRELKQMDIKKLEQYQKDVLKHYQTEALPRLNELDTMTADQFAELNRNINGSNIEIKRILTVLDTLQRNLDNNRRQPEFKDREAQQTQITDFRSQCELIQQKLTNTLSNISFIEQMRK